MTEKYRNRNGNIDIEITLYNAKIKGEVTYHTTQKGNPYCRFTVTQAGEKEKDKKIYFTVFCYNMHEADYIFKSCGYGDGDGITIKGKLENIMKVQNENGYTDTVIDTCITADKLAPGREKPATPSEVADQYSQPMPQAAPQAPAQYAPQAGQMPQQAPQQQMMPQQVPQQTPPQATPQAAPAPEEQPVRSFLEVEESINSLPDGFEFPL